jgi:hypothetical protein
LSPPCHYEPPGTESLWVSGLAALRPALHGPWGRKHPFVFRSPSRNQIRCPGISDWYTTKEEWMSFDQRVKHGVWKWRETLHYQDRLLHSGSYWTAINRTWAAISVRDACRIWLKLIWSRSWANRAKLGLLVQN